MEDTREDTREGDTREGDTREGEGTLGRGRRTLERGGGH